MIKLIALLSIDVTLLFAGFVVFVLLRQRRNLPQPFFGVVLLIPGLLTLAATWVLEAELDGWATFTALNALAMVGIGLVSGVRGVVALRSPTSPDRA